MFFSCKKDSTPAPPPAPAAPVANFSYSGAGVAPSTVTFTNSSTNATSYSWDFGDNGTSVDANPTHRYTGGGVYTVKLTVTGSGGSNSTTKTINITTPTTVKIMSVKLTAIPLTKSNGGSWDILPSSGPDVYIKITDNASTTYYNHPNYYQDVVASSLPLNFILQNSSSQATPLTITNLINNIALEVWDWDIVKPDELMSGFVFIPLNYTTGASAYPTTLILTGFGVTAEFTLQWQ
jgi:PKD repeat protein